jgi:hypothetical protein
LTLLNKEQLLAEVEDIITTMPPRATIRHDTQENVNWFGRASAAIENWNPSKSALVKEYLDLFFSHGHAAQTVYGLTKSHTAESGANRPSIRTDDILATSSSKYE